MATVVEICMLVLMDACLISRYYIKSMNLIMVQEISGLNFVATRQMYSIVHL